MLGYRFYVKHVCRYWTSLSAIKFSNKPFIIDWGYDKYSTHFTGKYVGTGSP